MKMSFVEGFASKMFQADCIVLRVSVVIELMRENWLCTSS